MQVKDVEFNNILLSKHYEHYELEPGLHLLHGIKQSATQSDYKGIFSL